MTTIAYADVVVEAPYGGHPYAAHGFYKEENNLRLYTEMLGFFDRHIGGHVSVGNPAKAN